jgi:hypothetical protein
LENWKWKGAARRKFSFRQLSLTKAEIPAQELAGAKDKLWNIQGLKKFMEARQNAGAAGD